MPDFDTGHLFLTFLSPIREGTTADVSGERMSHRQLLRVTLGLLPTALQSPATIKIGENSPFARNRQTHLCRMLVLDEVMFNGRGRKDAIVTALRRQDPIHPGPIDSLNCAYLVFCADIDAVMEEGDPLPKSLTKKQQHEVRDAYLRRLWATMEPELRCIYENCVGFDNVDSAEEFARYMARCQVETTMPFNDYWSSPPKLNSLPLVPMAVAALLPFMVTLLALIGGIAGMATVPILNLVVGWAVWPTFCIGLLATVAVIYGLYRYVLANGEKPMPPGQYGDLPGVLKSLYLQQHFANFAVDQQGADADALHTAFGAFLDQHRPSAKLAPSQAPGVISIASPNSIIE